MRRQGWREKVPRALSLSSCRVGGNRIQNRENEILSPDLLSVNKQVTVVVVPFASSSDAKAEKGREGRRKSPTTLLSSLPSPPPFLSVSPPLSSLIFPSLCSEAQFTSKGGRGKEESDDFFFFVPRCDSLCSREYDAFSALCRFTNYLYHCCPIKYGTSTNLQVNKKSCNIDTFSITT